MENPVEVVRISRSTAILFFWYDQTKPHYTVYYDVNHIGSSTTLKGYQSGSSVPFIASLEDHDTCRQCLCKPCIIELPPDFLVGRGPPHIRNQEKRYKLYRKFWSLLGSLGFWRDQRYLDRKRERTVIDDKREIIPACIVSVRAYTIL